MLKTQPPFLFWLRRHGIFSLFIVLIPNTSRVCCTDRISFGIEIWKDKSLLELCIEWTILKLTWHTYSPASCSVMSLMLRMSTPLCLSTLILGSADSTVWLVASTSNPFLHTIRLSPRCLTLHWNWAVSPRGLLSFTGSDVMRGAKAGLFVEPGMSELNILIKYDY